MNMDLIRSILLTNDVPVEFKEPALAAFADENLAKSMHASSTGEAVHALAKQILLSNNPAIPAQVKEYALAVFAEGVNGGLGGVSVTSNGLSAVISRTQYNEIVALMKGPKINAIKALRAATSWGLKESKDCIDALCVTVHLTGGTG